MKAPWKLLEGLKGRYERTGVSEVGWTGGAGSKITQSLPSDFRVFLSSFLYLKVEGRLSSFWLFFVVVGLLLLKYCEVYIALKKPVGGPVEAKFAHQISSLSYFLLPFLFFLAVDVYDLCFSLSLESLAFKVAQLLTAEVGVDLGATDAARNLFPCSFLCVFRALPHLSMLSLSFLIPF